MKSVMISIKPKWCELIANGEKTIDVRKTKPKIETPFKCYIYCTNIKNLPLKEYVKIHSKTCGAVDEWSCKVIGEFVCDGIIEMCDIGTAFAAVTDYDVTGCCLNYDELHDYGKGKFLYGWHISDLKIYDEPKELASFKVEDKHRIERCAARERVYNNPDFTNGAFLKGTYYCNKYNDFCDKCLTKELTQPPKSWYYVESVIE